MSSLISADNTWALWACLVGVAALSIWLEQKYQWASKLTGCVLALLGMMILSNAGIVPTESPVYDSVWSYAVPLAIPLLLFQCNIKKIGKESGKLLFIYLISSVGTVLGALGGFVALHKFVPDLNKVAAMFSGTYVGGSVNFAAMADTFGASGELSSQAVVADNLLMALYFFVLIAIPSGHFFRKHYKHPLIDQGKPATAAAPKTTGRQSQSPCRTSPSALRPPPSSWQSPPPLPISLQGCSRRRVQPSSSINCWATSTSS